MLRSGRRSRRGRGIVVNVERAGQSGDAAPIVGARQAARKDRLRLNSQGMLVPLLCMHVKDGHLKECVSNR